MKNILVSIITLLSFQIARAADFPELYCVSTKSFENVNQINIFTNKKGTMRINLQFYAVSDDGQDSGNFDTQYLQTITQLQFDTKSGSISNGANKLKLVIASKAISPKQAEEMMKSTSNAGLDFENPSGHKIDFKKYYAATMMAYNMSGIRGHWDATLMKAYKSGVTQYLCGKYEDVIGRRPTIFDKLGGSDND